MLEIVECIISSCSIHPGDRQSTLSIDSKYTYTHEIYQYKNDTHIICTLSVLIMLNNNRIYRILILIHMKGSLDVRSLARNHNENEQTNKQE